MKKKWSMLFGILMIFCMLGCGKEGAIQEETKEAEEAAPKASYCTAAEDFGNLQLTEANIPVYDKLTLKERREKGLPTVFPQITPFREGKIAYLTFDDGPDDKNTPAVLDILKKEGVCATFYVTGQHAELYPDTIKRMAEEGHAIGNHSYDHDYHRLYASTQNFLREMEQTDEILMKIIGMRPLIIRAPGGVIGHFNQGYWDALKASALVEHDWNVSSADAAPNHPVAQDFIDNINGQTEGKGENHAAIILMHSSEGHEETVKALPEIIKLLKAKGYSFGVITPMTPQPW